MRKYIVVLLLGLISCGEKLPIIPPVIVTEKVTHDTDDPAIWVNPTDPSKSIVFGTDKDTNGAIYAFDLEGKIISDKIITGIKYPNNIDVEYGLQLNDSIQTDIIVFTERERNMLRLFSVPDMKELDNGGFPVFEDEVNPANRLPMGIGLYKNPKTNEIDAIVSRKTGPKEGYLYQYRFVTDGQGKIDAKFIRKFGAFSGVKEIEAIAVDNKSGLVYYSDEGVAIRKYFADPKKGNQELAAFGKEYFKEDIEGIALTMINGKEYIIVSDQQRGTFNIFSQEDNRFIKAVNFGTDSTDGCEAVNIPLNGTFKNGLFVSMNENRNFFFHDLSSFDLN